MSFGSSGALGLLLLLGSVAACTGEASTPQEPSGVAALPAYEPPSGAPEFCALLAGSTHLATVPSALGVLTVDPSDATARQELTGAVEDLRPVLEDVRFAVEHADLETAVEDLVAALAAASGGRLTDDTSETVARALTAVAEQTQPVCEFPA